MLTIGKTKFERFEAEWILERIGIQTPYPFAKCEAYGKERSRLAMMFTRIQQDRNWVIRTNVIGGELVIIRER